MGKTAIGWTDFSVNPIRARNLETGDVGHFCEKVSPGCAHCYSSVWNVAQRHKRKDGAEAVTGTGLDFLPVNRSKVELFLHEETLREPLKRRKPTKWFWCDMTDLFADFVDDDTIDRCFAVMAMTPHHVHQVLTKRPERMAAYLNAPGRREAIANQIAWVIPESQWYAPLRPNGPSAAAVYEGIDGGWRTPLHDGIWLGTSVEDQPRADERIQHLLRCPAAVRFLSCEPLLGAIDLAFCDEWRSVSTIEEDPCYGVYPDGSTNHSPPGFTICPSRRHWRNLCDFRKSACGVDWAIIGDESGPKRRRSPNGAAEDIVEQCIAAGVAVYVKQLNIGGKVTTDMSLFPEHLRYQDFPVPGVEQRRIEG